MIFRIRKRKHRDYLRRQIATVYKWWRLEFSIIEDMDAG